MSKQTTALTQPTQQPPNRDWSNEKKEAGIDPTKMVYSKYFTHGRQRMLKPLVRAIYKQRRLDLLQIDPDGTTHETITDQVLLDFGQLGYAHNTQARPRVDVYCAMHSAAEPLSILIDEMEADEPRSKSQ